MGINWLAHQWNCYFGLLCKFGRGNLGSRLMWILSLIFMGLDFQPKMNPPYSHWTPWWALVQTAQPSAVAVNLSWCPRPPGEACRFCKCIIPIRMLKSGRLEAAQCQQTHEEPNSSWQQSRWERPGASAGPQQSKIHKTLPRLHGCVYPSEINSARASSVSPQTPGAIRNGPCTDF